MKYHIIVCIVAVFQGVNATFSRVPGNNSLYVEGVSRYIWMPYGNEIPYLVDLQKPVFYKDLNNDAVNNQYWLYTRFNPTSPQMLIHGDATSVANSNYSPNKPSNFIVHGWGGDVNSSINPLLTLALLNTSDANVIVVDWRKVASGNYLTACRGVPSVGQDMASFITWLFDTADGEWNTLHLIGFSLGAHVVGYAGRLSSKLPNRITGLDPAGPLWKGNANALNKNDGKYVESIHTDRGFLGTSDSISDADFFPNGGRHPQPGCLLSSCSHGRSFQLFASSVMTDRFVARRCSGQTQAVLQNCKGAEMNMGNNSSQKKGQGLYGLKTGKSWPF